MAFILYDLQLPLPFIVLWLHSGGPNTLHSGKD